MAQDRKEIYLHEMNVFLTYLSFLGVDLHIRNAIDRGEFESLACAQCAKKIKRADIIRRQANMSSSTIEA